MRRWLKTEDQVRLGWNFKLKLYWSLVKVFIMVTNFVLSVSFLSNPSRPWHAHLLQSLVGLWRFPSFWLSSRLPGRTICKQSGGSASELAFFSLWQFSISVFECWQRYFSKRVRSNVSRKQGSRYQTDIIDTESVPYRLVFKRYWKALIGTCGAWWDRVYSPFIIILSSYPLPSGFFTILWAFFAWVYLALTSNQVTFPNGVFSGTIISSIIHDGDIKRTAEWQLLLGAMALPGVFVGALLCNPFGRRNTVSLTSLASWGVLIIFTRWCLGLAVTWYLVRLFFSGVFHWSLNFGIGLIIGLAYDKITKIIPLFVILYVPKLCKYLA